MGKVAVYLCLFVAAVGCGGGSGGRTPGGFYGDDISADSTTRDTLLALGPLFLETNRADYSGNAMKIEASRKPMESQVQTLVGKELAFRVKVGEIENLERFGKTVVRLQHTGVSFRAGPDTGPNPTCGSMTVSFYLPNASSYGSTKGDSERRKKFEDLCKVEFYGDVETAKTYERQELAVGNLRVPSAPHDFLTVGKHISESAASSLSVGDYLVIRGVVGGAEYIPDEGLMPEGGSVFIYLCGISLAD